MMKYVVYAVTTSATMLKQIWLAFQGYNEPLTFGCLNKVFSFLLSSDSPTAAKCALKHSQKGAVPFVRHNDFLPSYC